LSVGLGCLTGAVAAVEIAGLYAVAYPAIGIGAAIVGCGIGGWVAYANGEIITP
jgi:hypothetical protein